MSHSPDMDAFVAEAEGIDLLSAFERAGGSYSGLKRVGGEHIGPCPACGGRDRFSLNAAKQVFNCRGGEGGGPLKLIMHVAGVGFLDACEIALGRDRPGQDEAGRALRDAARAEAETRLRKQRAESDAKAARQAEDSERFRQREWERCVTDWREARPLRDSPAAAYLDARGLPQPDEVFARCHPALSYFHEGVVVHRGPALLVLFVVPIAGKYRPIGLHRTWVDPTQGPKFRPEILDPKTGELLASKKMRGSKAGGLLPLAGRLSEARRMVVGEGIETVLGYRKIELSAPPLSGKPLAGTPVLPTFYCAAGDLGNLAGRAAKGSRIRDTTKVKRDRLGRGKPVFVPGEEPDWDSAAIPVPDQIEELVLLGDGDSDPVLTRAAMHRARNRHAREGRRVVIQMAAPGSDWAEIAAFSAPPLSGKPLAGTRESEAA